MVLKVLLKAVKAAFSGVEPQVMYHVTCIVLVLKTKNLWHF
jgi:hypothetical protein